MADVSTSYEFWQKAGWDWYAEVRLRWQAEPVYARQEAYLKAFFEAKAAEWAAREGRPLRVLEFGCGFGRHLKYLHLIPNLEVHGCDQSPAMLSVARTLLLGRFPELQDRIARVAPQERLPYDDASFDVVYTVSVLIHVAPEDLAGRVAELRRVAGHMVLNLELPPTPHSFLWDETHNGCWLHDFIGVHQEAGPCSMEVDADALAPRVTVYKVLTDAPPAAARVLLNGQWAEEPDQIGRACLDAVLGFAKFCQTRAQSRSGDTQRMLDRTRERLGRIREKLDRTRRGLDALKKSRAVRMADWLHGHRRLSWLAHAAFGAVAWLRGLLPGRRPKRTSRPAAPADEAHAAPQCEEHVEGTRPDPGPPEPAPDGAEREDRGY